MSLSYSPPDGVRGTWGPPRDQGTARLGNCCAGKRFWYLWSKEKDGGFVASCWRVEPQICDEQDSPMFDTEEAAIRWIENYLTNFHGEIRRYESIRGYVS